MPKLRIIGLSLIIIFILFCLLLFLGVYYLSLIAVVLFICLYNIFHKLVAEELIIIELYKIGLKTQKDNLYKMFPKAAKSALLRLENKNYIKIEDSIVELVVKDYKFSIIKGEIK